MWSNILLEPKVFNRFNDRDENTSLPNYLCPKCGKLDNWEIEEFPLCLNCDPSGVCCMSMGTYDMEKE